MSALEYTSEGWKLIDFLNLNEEGKPVVQAPELSFHEEVISADLQVKTA